MDVLFQILIPELKLIEGLEVHQEKFTWDGVDYPQEPVTYLWGEHIKLVKRDIQGHIPRFLPANFLTKQWVFLDVEGDGLDLLELETNGVEVDWGNRRLDDLLRSLLNCYDRWAVLFELYSDQIDNTYELSVDGLVQKLKANLARDVEREGFIAFCRKG